MCVCPYCVSPVCPNVCPGVAYTSECFLCRPGWFSPAPGSSSCQPCPSNTFSTKGASSCTACPENHYSRMHTCDKTMQLCIMKAQRCCLNNCTVMSCGSVVGLNSYIQCEQQRPCHVTVNKRDFVQ